MVYAEEAAGQHGNFLAASYRRIRADALWRRRLQKSYTGAEHLPRRHDRSRGELECCNSSDALLMNIFCYPGVLRRPATCALLGISPGLRPDFGVRAALPMHRDEVDRTEWDMCLGDLVAEAKLTEATFGIASRERLLRYKGLEELFDLHALPWGSRGVAGYQLIRGALAAFRGESRYLLLLDARRTNGRSTDLRELWFQVLAALHSSAMRNRMVLLSWQELAATLPPRMQTFLSGSTGSTGAKGRESLRSAAPHDTARLTVVQKAGRPW